MRQRGLALNPEYFAHSLEGVPDTTEWERLEDHLRRVASTARGFAEAFDSGDWGYLAGLWHDLGKYTQEFQARLRGEPIAVTHSTAGARHAWDVDRRRGTLLAFAIAGHHAGLANLSRRSSSKPTTPLEDRLKNPEDIVVDWDAIPKDIRDARVPDLPTYLGQRDEKGVRRTEFFIRFLFSTLVDADRLNSELFTSPDRAALRSRHDSIEMLCDRLDTYIDKKVGTLPVALRDTPVNRVRAEVLEGCRAQAVRARGLYSLTVPTGGGKTLSAMSFALRHAVHHGLRRIIVVIPYTSIIEQNAGVYAEALGIEHVLEHHSTLDPERVRGEKGEELTTRNELAAENWDAPVVVTTTVQFFESLFSNRPGACRKLHNIAQSMLLFDEVQTLPPGFLVSILDGLRQLVAHYGCTAMLATATPPALKARENFTIGLEGVEEIVPDPVKMARDLRRVIYRWPKPDDNPVEWETLAEELAGHEQVLAVVHRRRDARELAELLRQRVEPDAIHHMSALMCPAHRKAVLKIAKQRLKEQRPCRLVSTQLVEAGVDIDFPIVYRALGGLDSIVQAAGRCNREGRNQRGEVVVFRAPTQPPPGVQCQALDVTLSLLRETQNGLDADNPEVFQKYFSRLYTGAILDVKSIERERQSFNFATVSQKFRLIEDAFQHAVVVPYGDAADRLRQLEDRFGSMRDKYRALQPYTVQIHEYRFEPLLRDGVLTEVVEGVFTLTQPHQAFYDAMYGLRIGDEPQANPQSLVV